MNRLPRITGAELLRALQQDGWQEVHRVGSHVQLKHPVKAGKVTVPYHRGVVLYPKTLSAVLEQAGLTVEEVRKLL